MTADGPAGTDRRRRLLLAGVAALVVLGLALGAASLDEVRLSAAGGEAGSSQHQPEAVGETSPGTGGDDETTARISPYYLLVFYVIGVFALVGFGWRKDFLTATESLAVLAVLFGFLLFVIGMDSSAFAENATGGNLTEIAEDPQVGSGPGDEPNTSPPASALPMGMLVMLGVVLGVGIVIGFSRSRSVEGDESDDEEDVGEGDAATAAAIGDAAGRAADRMAATDVENPVFRAWRDMTEALERTDDPTLTPAEFRDRAVAAGLPAREVSALTDVFREVRYGHESVTPTREETAREALREVERAAAEIAAAADEGTGEAAPVAGAPGEEADDLDVAAAPDDQGEGDP